MYGFNAIYTNGKAPYVLRGFDNPIVILKHRNKNAKAKTRIYFIFLSETKAYLKIFPSLQC